LNKKWLKWMIILHVYSTLDNVEWKETDPGSGLHQARRCSVIVFQFFYFKAVNSTKVLYQQCRK